LEKTDFHLYRHKPVVPSGAPVTAAPLRPAETVLLRAETRLTAAVAYPARENDPR